jgi:hypothetical protein
MRSILVKLSYLSCLLTQTAFISNFAFSQEDAGSEATGGDVVDDGTTPYSDSFTTGDVVPTPPPEGEPDTSGIDSNPELNPDPDKMFDDEDSLKERPFIFGFTGALAVPHIINTGFETLTYKKYGASLNYGNISRNINGVDVGLKHYDVRLRYHPWSSSFFAGVALGKHMITGQKSKDINVTYNGTKSNVPTKLKVTASANYIAPHIGWFVVWEPGFTMGLDLGWMIPSGATSKAEATFANLPDGAESAIRATPEFTSATSDVEKASDDYVKKSIPFISMIRIGWMF